MSELERNKLVQTINQGMAQARSQVPINHLVHLPFGHSVRLSTLANTLGITMLIASLCFFLFLIAFPKFWLLLIYILVLAVAVVWLGTELIRDLCNNRNPSYDDEFWNRVADFVGRWAIIPQETKVDIQERLSLLIYEFEKRRLTREKLCMATSAICIFGIVISAPAWLTVSAVVLAGIFWTAEANLRLSWWRRVNDKLAERGWMA